MTGEMEAAAADSLGEIFKRRGTHPFAGVGTPCANCGTTLEGPYCHACGQNADTHKRSILHLVWEAIEGMFHLDGRLAATLPALFLRPGALARDYMEGRIVRHVPPFRTFLVALLLFIFAAEHAIHASQHHAEQAREAKAALLATSQGRAAEATRLKAEAAKDRDDALKEAAAERDADLKDPDNAKAEVAADYAKAVAKLQARYAEDVAQADRIAAGDLPKSLGLSEEEARKAEAAKIRSLPLGDGEIPMVQAGHGRHAGGWLKESIAKARENPELYQMVLFTWGHRLAVLLLPIVGLSLALVYRNKPKFFIYDHLLVAMNLLSFAFLTNALGLVLPEPVKTWWFGLLVLWTPVNLFQTLRGAYGSSFVGATLKTLVVWFVTVLSFSLLLAGLALLALAQI
ncbi:DUF3667 domain-containing protein [Caulobacter sp. LARHSG274]